MFGRIKRYIYGASVEDDLLNKWITLLNKLSKASAHINYVELIFTMINLGANEYEEFVRTLSSKNMDPQLYIKLEEISAPKYELIS